MPISLADSSTDVPESSCSFFSPLSCLGDTARMISYSTGLAAQPFLHYIRNLMITEPNTEVFNGVWLSITGIISIFYIFFLLYSGITLIVSGDDLVKRHKAKENIKNLVIAIVLVSSSFYLYNLMIDLNSSLTSYVFSNVSSEFFTVSSDNFGNALLQIILIVPYIIVLLVTCIMFLARYLFVCLGVIFFPLGILFYFVPFLKSYGKLIINFTILLIFIPFISSIIILGSSVLINAPVVQNFVILFYIVAFLLVDFIFYLLIKFVVNKTGAGELYSGIKTAVMIAAGGL
ncbi:hypothetical protein J4476_05605 [Candidatus Woesearchaeota archaeon]|nr:hypothetical protein [Candidatus Woesearchaeota archaeon]